MWGGVWAHVGQKEKQEKEGLPAPAAPEAGCALCGLPSGLSGEPEAPPAEWLCVLCVAQQPAHRLWGAGVPTAEKQQVESLGGPRLPAQQGPEQPRGTLDYAAFVIKY